jgi:hypothetical protein
MPWRAGAGEEGKTSAVRSCTKMRGWLGATVRAVARTTAARRVRTRRARPAKMACPLAFGMSGSVKDRVLG